jgi:hypothetical protein
VELKGEVKVMKLKAFAFLLLITCLSNNIAAQEKPELFSNIERVFREKEPAWKVERIYPSNTSDPLMQSIVFRSRKNQASIEVSIWKREKDARDVFAAHSIVFSDTMGKRMVKSRLPSLGDENYIWTHRSSTAWPTIKFRKGTIIVNVFAPSVAIAKRFALHVSEQIAAL